MKKVMGLLLALIGQAMVLLLGSVMPVSAQQSVSGRLEIISNIGEEEMSKYLDGFLKKYPDVEIDYLSYGDYENSIKKRMESGDYGDVLFIPGFVQQEQLGTYFAPMGEYTQLTEKYLYLEMSQRVGKIVYGLPSYAYTAGILYNRDVFYQAGISELPRTMEEFLDALQNIKERTEAIPFFTNYMYPWALQVWENFPYIEMTGNPHYKDNLFIKEKDPFLKDSAHYQVYELLYDIVELGMSEEELKKYTWEQSKNMLVQGDVGCMVIGSWAVSQFKEAASDGEAIAFMPFPNEIGGKQYMTISTDYCYGISRNSDNPEAARAYIEYMLDESGYALDHENLSIVKTDPYPDSYGNMEDVILLCNTPASGSSYQTKLKLSANLNMEDGKEAMRVIEAAKGIRRETFDDIAQDWNTRWEACRTADMPVEEEEVKALFESVVTDNYEVNFSQTEKEFLESKGSLRVGYTKNMAPFQYEKEGNFTGLASYVCEVIGEATGLSIECVPYENTEEMVAALSRGDVDMLACMDAEGEYGYQLQYSKAYLSPMSVLIRNDAMAVGESDSSGGAGVRGEKMNRALKAQGVEEEYATYAEVVAAIDKAASDWAVMNYYMADYYIQEMECKNVSVMPLSETESMCLAFAGDVDTRLISICNKCIYGISKENVQVVLREYMEPTVKPVTLKRFIEENPITSIFVLLGIFGFIVLAFLAIMREKSKSARKQALDVERYELLTSLVDEYIVEYDYATEVWFFDHKLQERFAINKSVKLSGEWDNNENVNRVLQRYHQALQENKESTQPFELTDIDGKKQWYRLLFRIIYKNDGTPRNVIGKICNIQKEMEELRQAEDSAQRDALTGIYNRKGFDRKLAELQERAVQYLPFTLVVMDLDDFKGVNDTLGHSGGDAVLRLLARKLEEVFGEHAVIARFGGDEFMLCTYKLGREAVTGLLARLVKEMDVDFRYQDLSRKVSVSVGAVYSEECREFETLFEEADKALYETKERGKNGYVINYF